MSASTSSIHLHGQQDLAGMAVWRLVLLAASAVAVVAITFALPVIPYGRAVWDFLFVLDGAYRIGSGNCRTSTSRLRSAR